MVQLSTPWGDPYPGNGPPVRRFLSNYFDLLLLLLLLSQVHTGDKVEFNTVYFVESRQSRPCRFEPVRTGNKVDRIGNKVDSEKMSNSRCCRFVTKTGNKVERMRQ